MTYRKLDKPELQELYKNLRGYFENSTKYAGLVRTVNKYFPNAQSILVEVESKYNDSTYDNSIGSIYVYGEKDIEIPLSRMDRELFNEEIRKSSYDFVPEEANHYIDAPIVIYVNKDLPEIYIKEK